MARERLPLIKQQKESKERTLESIKHAQECLSDTKFAKYKETAERDLSNIFTTILNYKNTDPMQYAFYIQAKVKEYNNLSFLLNRVETDAGVINEIQ